MKIRIDELRDMIAEAVKLSIKEGGRKKKEIPPRSQESVEAEREAHVTGIPGYTQPRPLDMSKPLGKRNIVKRQGTAGIAWTSETKMIEAIRKLVRMVIDEEIGRR